MSLQPRRSLLAVPVALLLSLLLAGQVLAAHGWSAPIPLTSTGSGFPFGIARVDNDTAVAALVEWNGNGYDVLARRSTTSGSSWDPPITLSTGGYFPAVAALDPFVDFVWEQNGRVRYARSNNGGASFGPSVALSKSTFPLGLSVARGPDGLVVVAWENGNTKRIRARVSTDGGLTFGRTAAFDSHTQEMATAVAAGDGVAYLAYKTRYYRLVVRRSLDGGQTWSAPFVGTTEGYGLSGHQFSLTASGSHAYLAYTDSNPNHPAWGTVRYRRTLDSGVSWSAQRDLAPPMWKTETPDIFLLNGVVRAVYERRATVYGVNYQQSADGLSWSTAEQVETGGAFRPLITKAGDIIVLYQVGAGDAVARTGT